MPTPSYPTPVAAPLSQDTQGPPGTEFSALRLHVARLVRVYGLRRLSQYLLRARWH